jgi:hypothetical protein
MIREAAEPSAVVVNDSADFSAEHSAAIAQWLDELDRPDQLWMLHEMRDRISASGFNSRFGNENSNNHFDVVGDLRECALAVKINNNDIQPESADEYLKDSRDGEDNWYHLTPLGLEFVRSVLDSNGPPFIAPAVVADDLRAFLRGLPDEARRFDEHLVRTDQYETEAEFDSFRETVRTGDYTGPLAPPVVPEDPYLLPREMNVSVYEGANTLEGQRTIETKVANAIRGRTQVRLFGPWAPTKSVQVFDETPELPNMYHQFVTGQKFMDRIESDEDTDAAELFLQDARDHSDVRVESTDRYLPYVLGILENRERTDSELFIWGRGNPEEDSYMMFATTKDPSPALYDWATELFKYVSERAEAYDG